MDVKYDQPFIPPNQQECFSYFTHEILIKMTFLIKNVKQLENAKQKPYFSETEQTLLSTQLGCIFQAT